MIEKTNCLTFCCHGFQDGRACPVCKGVPQFSDNAATVTRTCESLVGEKGQMNREASAYAKYVGLDAKPTAVDEPELQLLVIDMGDVCIVRVEKGHWDVSDLIYPSDVWTTESTNLMRFPFSRIREDLDGEKPVPRIETELNQNGYTDYILRYKDGGIICVQFLTQSQFTALSELAGKPLPIYECGKWERLDGKFNPMDAYGELPVKVWRYRRD